MIVSVDEALVLLRRAGSIMRRMPGGGVQLGMSQGGLDAIADPREAYGYSPVEVNRLPPSSAEISMMDFVMPWLSYIPDEKMVVRRVVAHRMIWNDERGRSVWPYKRLSGKIGTSPELTRRWDEDGVLLIQKALNKQNRFHDKIGLYLKELEGAYDIYSDLSVPVGGH